jgi:hypothetical protein
VQSRREIAKRAAKSGRGAVRLKMERFYRAGASGKRQKFENRKWN